MAVVFDTNIIVDALNGRPEAHALVLRDDAPAISVVTWIEVLVGCRDQREERSARWFMHTLDVIALESEIVERAITVRRTRRLKLPDAIILATARHLGCPLLTRNTRDFGAGDPDVVVPYTV